MANLQLRFFSESSSFLPSNGRRLYFFDLTDSKVVSAILYVRNCESSQDFCTFRAYFEVCALCRYASPELKIFSHWKIYHEIVYFLNFEESVLEFHVS